MGKFKGPAFPKTFEFEKWEKLLRNWIRTISKEVSNSEIVAAIISGLSDSSTRNGALDAILDLDDAVLYQEMDDEHLICPERYAEMSDAQKKTAIDGIKAEFDAEGKGHFRPSLRYIVGVERILATLQRKYGLTEDRKVFTYYEQLQSIRRPPTQSINDFICTFESHYRKLQSSGVTLHPAILGYTVLKACALSETEEKLARTSASKMTFEDMRASLEKLGDNLPVKPSSRGNASLDPIEVLFQREESNEDSNEEENTVHDEESEEDLILYNRQTGKSYKFKHQMGKKKFNYKSPRTNSRDGPQGSGKISTCAICSSIYHWAPECPHKDENNRKLNKPEKILKVDALIPAHDLEEDLTFITEESNNLALIDSGATTTVVGCKWMKNYEEGLDPRDRNLINEKTENRLFRFGDGNAVQSSIIKLIPTVLCQQEVIIQASVVDADIPLLISRSALRKAKATLDFEKDCLEMNKIKQQLFSTPSGHYAVPIGPNVENLSYSAEPDSHAVYAVTENEEDPEKIALKVHRYFAHANPERLKTFVRTTTHPKKEEIAKALGKLNCDWCKKHKRETPKPKTCLPLAERFNQTIALDLKFLDKTKEIVLHCIDIMTRFSTAVIIPNKKQETIVEHFCRSWIAIFGRPEQTLCDNGKEFCNKDFTDLCQNLMIEVNTTAAFSPWSNGMVERHNGLIADMVYKLKEDVQCSSEIAVCWAVNAKNNMVSVHGFSPQQLVFGANSPVPGLDADKVHLHQLGSKESSKIVADNINAMYNARKAFLEAQNSDRLKRALRDRVYSAYEKQYYPGDKVYFRTTGTDWKPGVVIGQYMKLVLVKTGGLFVRVHPSKIVLRTDADDQIIGSYHPPESTESPEDTPLSSGDSDESSDCEEPYFRDCGESKTQEPEIVQPEQLHEAEDNITRTSTNTSWVPITENESRGRYILSTGDKIRYKERQDSPISHATVTGPAGRATGRNKNRYNIECNGERLSIFADKLNMIEKTVVTAELGAISAAEEEENNEILSEQQTDGSILFMVDPTPELIDEMKMAKEKEISNFKHFGVFEEVPRNECDTENIVSSVWITKRKDDGSLKARLVARGFQESHKNLKVDAPTVDKTSIRIFLTCIPFMDWKCGSLDIKAAFLQSHTLERKVYLLPPPDVRKQGVIWLVKKPIYGLKDSARNWYKTIESDLKKIGCIQSILDPTVFMCRDSTGNLIGIFICHVDDFLYSIGNDDFNKNVITKIKEIYSISSENIGDFDYVGLKIEQDQTGIYLSQPEFTKSLEPLDTSSLKLKKEDHLDIKWTEAYQCLLGKIHWLTHQTRPDIAFHAFTYSLFQKAPTFERLKGLNKLVSMVKDGPPHLKLSNLDRNSLKIICFSDASFANVLPDKTTSGEGYLIFIGDKHGNCALVDWKSKKISRVVHSTQSAECLALVDGLGDACYIRNLLEEILWNQPRSNKITIEVYVDSSQLFKAISSTHMITDKLRRLNIAELKQLIHPPDNNILLFWIPTDLMISDCLTKVGASRDNLRQVMTEGKLDQRLLETKRACLEI